MRTLRSPIRSTSFAATGEARSRIPANTETTLVAAIADTPNSRANVGITGTTMPNPSETENAMRASAVISTGKSRSSGILFCIKGKTRLCLGILQHPQALRGLFCHLEACIQLHHQYVFQ